MCCIRHLFHHFRIYILLDVGISGQALEFSNLFVVVLRGQRHHGRPSHRRLLHPNEVFGQYKDSKLGDIEGNEIDVWRVGVLNIGRYVMRSLVFIGSSDL